MAHTSLASLFGDIADAIRAKTGSSASIVADVFPTAIAAIPAGLTMGTATYTPGSNTYTISFAVSGEPQYFCCMEAKTSGALEPSGSTYFPVVAVWYDGTTVYYLRLGSSSKVYNYSGKFTQTYSSTEGTLTLKDTTSGSSNAKTWFLSGVPYKLLYFY